METQREDGNPSRAIRVTDQAEPGSLTLVNLLAETRESVSELKRYLCLDEDGDDTIPATDLVTSIKNTVRSLNYDIRRIKDSLHEIA